MWVRIRVVADHPLELANVVTPASPYLETLGEVDYYCKKSETALRETFKVCPHLQSSADLGRWWSVLTSCQQETTSNGS